MERDANEREAFGRHGGEEAAQQQSVVVIELNGGSERQGDIGEDDAEAFHPAAGGGARDVEVDVVVVGTDAGEELLRAVGREKVGVAGQQVVEADGRFAFVAAHLEGGKAGRIERQDDAADGVLVKEIGREVVGGGLRGRDDVPVDFAPAVGIAAAPGALRGPKAF